MPSDPVSQGRALLQHGYVQEAIAELQTAASTGLPEQLAEANNLLGLAAGPFAVGLLADRVGLVHAMRLVPLMSVVVILVLLIGRRRDAGLPGPSAPTAGAERTDRGRTVREG